MGYVLSDTDALGHTTTYERDGEGRVTRMVRPELDGEQPVHQYFFTYDTYGNLTSRTQPDGSQELWTYDPTFHQVTSYTGPLGNVTEYDIDPETGLVLSETRAVTDGPDVVTQFTYTAAPSDPGDPPAGLVETVTDPLGRVTSVEYNSRGLVTRTTFAVGTDQEALVEMEYDAADNLVARIDELGRRTEYTYDNLGRMTSILGPDPDGGGGPLTTFQYEAAGRLVLEVDPLGREVQYTYDAMGNVTQITHSHDGSDPVVTSLDYDPAGRLIARIDPLGRVTGYGYDALGRRISTTLPDPQGDGSQPGPVSQSAFDPLGRIVSQTDPLGNETTWAYEDFGRRVITTLPEPDGDGPLESPQTIREFDAAANLISETDALGRVTTYAYDELGRRVSITRPDPDGSGGPVTQFQYDKVGNLRFVTDPLGNVTEYLSDARNRLVEIVLPDPGGQGSPNISYTYDAAGQMLTETDPLGNVTSYAWDALGRMTLMTLPHPDDPQLAGPQHSYSYDLVGNRLSETDPLGNTTFYEYDSHNRLVQLTLPDPDGPGPLEAPVLTYAYDAAGQLLSQSDPLGNTTSFQYDALGRMVQRTLPDPDGQGPLEAPVYSYTYDLVGNLLSQTDPLDNTTALAYDNLYRRTSTTDALGGVTSFSYDAVGNLLSLTDPVGNTTSWVYDSLNRTVEETNELNDTRYFSYDLAGNVVERTDRNGRVIQWDYDDLYRRTEERWLDDGQTVRTLSFGFDAVGQLITASDPAASYTYAYDGLGRKTSITHDLSVLSFSVVLSHTYDAASNRTQLAAQIGGTADFVTDYQFDGLNRMTRIEQSGQPGGNAVAEKRVDLAYDAAGRFETITRHADLAATQLVAQSHFTYDGLGRMTSLAHDQGANTLAGYQWSHDVASRVTQFVSLTDGTADYSYDATGQLVGAAYDYQENESFSYDANGNRTTAGYVTGANNQLLSDGTYDYQYDAEGNRVKRTHIASGAVTEYDWDHHNRLVRIVDRESEGGTPTNVVEYTYDLFGRRISKSWAPGVGPAAPEDIQSYIYDGERHQRGNAGDHIALAFDGNSQLTHRILHGPLVDQVLANEQVEWVSEPGEVFWPLTDNLGTVRDVAEHDDGTGTTSVANHLIYGAFGNLMSKTDSAIGHLFGFTGREQDVESDLQFNRARFYAAELGRWMSEDPIGFNGGDANTYRYANNTPPNSTDPSGLVITHISGTAELHERFNQLLQQLAQIETNIAGCLARRALNDPHTFIRVRWVPGAAAADPPTPGRPGGVILVNSEDPTLLPSGLAPDDIGLADVDNDLIAQVVIVHELGHRLLNCSDPTPRNPGGGNVTLCENPFRELMGLEPRPDYNGQRIPNLADVNPQERINAEEIWQTWGPPLWLPPELGLGLPNWSGNDDLPND